MSEISEYAKRVVDRLYTRRPRFYSPDWDFIAQVVQEAIDEATAGKDAEIERLKAERAGLVSALMAFAAFGADSVMEDLAKVVLERDGRTLCDGAFLHACLVLMELGEMLTKEEAAAAMARDNADAGKGNDG